MSLEELPQAILRVILEYIPDAETLCNLDSTCQEFHKLAREDFVWKPRLECQWHIRRPRNNNSHNDSHASSQTPLCARDEYVRRWIIDNEISLCVSRLTRTTEQLKMLYAFSFVMAKGSDAVDICWKLFQHHKNPETQKFARGILRMVHCGSVASDLVKVLNDDRSDRAPGERLEDACILTTSMFREMSTVEDRTAETIKSSLDEIAKKIQSGFTENMSLTAKLQRVDCVFFRDNETCFTGNMENYYDYRNSLLDSSLDRRKAIPMTLALLYKFICRRLDIIVEVVGLPGHIVAHVPALDRFVDVFEGGQQLSAAECVDIVTNFGYPMQQSYLSPLPPELIVQRILNNVENCLVRHPTVRTPVSARQRAAITAMRAIASNPRNDQLMECRHLLVLTFVSEACVGTDISDW